MLARVETQELKMAFEAEEMKMKMLYNLII